MKKMNWKGWIVLAAIMTGAGCQKQDSAENLKTGSRFDAGAAKEWYYGAFKKSPGWQSSPEKGKKLPDWSHPFITNIGSSAVVEFPLTEAGASYSIASSGSEGKLPAELLKRIAAASITRIAFIRQPSGNVVVREFEYIPDWDYLQARRFDISNASIFSESNDFSGRLVVKEWGGKIVSMAMLENGKTIKRGKRNTGVQNGNTLKREQCFEQEFCVWQMDCTVTIYGDGMITQDCTDWYNTGDCWMEYWCEEGGDPCELAGIGCGGEEEEEGPDCDALQDQSEGASVSEEVSSETISQTPTTRTKKYHWVIYKQNQNLWKFTSHESGVHMKTNSITNPWQWQSLEHINVSREGNWTGGVVECTVNTSDAQLGLYWASIELNYTITASAICRGFPIGGSATHTSAKIIGINE